MARVVSITPARLDRDSRTLKMATSLARLGHESTVVEAQRSETLPIDPGFELLTVSSLGEGLADVEGDGPAVDRGFVERIAELLGRIAGPLYFLASFAAFNLRTARRLPAADLYWLHGYEQSLAVWLRRRPYVYDAHDFYVALPQDGRPLTLNERATHRVRLALERACARRARARVTTSSTMARLCEGGLGRPFRVVWNSQDPRLAQPAEDDVRTRCGVPAEAFLIAMVGNNKPGTVIPEQLPDGVHVVFVGAGYEELEAPGRVHFAGPVPPEQVDGFLSTADASALFYEPVNENSQAQLVNGLFHAVQAQLPLLYPTGMDAIRDVAEHYGLGVGFDPADPASLGEAVARLRAEEDRHRANVAAAGQELDWVHQEDTLQAIVREALA